MQRHGPHAGDGGDGDNAACPTPGHAVAKGHGRIPSADLVDINDAADLFLRQILGAQRALDDAGGGHQDIDRPEGCFDLGRRRLIRRLGRDIEGDGDAGNFPRQRRRAWAIAIGHHNPMAARSQHAGAGGTNAARAASHHGDHHGAAPGRAARHSMMKSSSPFRSPSVMISRMVPMKRP